MEVMNNDPKVLQDPAPSVTVLELGDSSVNLAVRPHSTTADYWDVYFGITEKVKVALDQAESIPTLSKYFTMLRISISFKNKIYLSSLPDPMSHDMGLTDQQGYELYSGV